MTRADALLILRSAGATELQATQFVGRRTKISAEVVAGAVAVICSGKKEEQS